MKLILASLYVVSVALGFALGYYANQPEYAYTTEEYINDATINMQALGHEFAGIPTDRVHIMRVWEDGSYEVEYQDGTSEIGCLTTGLCQD